MAQLFQALMACSFLAEGKRMDYRPDFELKKANISGGWKQAKGFFHGGHLLQGWKTEIAIIL